MLRVARWGNVLALVALLSCAGLPQSATGADSQPVIVAVLDSGIYAEHEAFEAGQVVAWYDFTRDGGPPAPRLTWDPRVEPYDNHGHGTAVAGMVGGAGAGQTPSHAPGVKLAIARIAPDTTIHDDWTNIQRAIRWAVDIVHADILSLSYYGPLPSPGYDAFKIPGGGGPAWNPVAEELRYARAQGVLPVVLAGNNLNHTQPLPMTSILHPPAYSPAALVVGGMWNDARAVAGLAEQTRMPYAPQSAMEPEVTAAYFVEGPALGCASCYVWLRGTSFGTPLVAGMAASLLQASRDAGQPDPGPDRLEHILKWAAVDAPWYPPSLEGYGYLGEPEVDLARRHLLAGTTPNGCSAAKLASAVWVETVQGVGRRLWVGQPADPIQMYTWCQERHGVVA